MPWSNGTPCTVAGCSERATVRGRCRAHATAHEVHRGTKQERGYDAAFEAAKRHPWYRDAVRCATCKQPFTADNPKTAGHVVALRRGGGSAVKPECRRCNFGWRRTGS